MSGERLNDSTRHLSAGVYLDGTYRDRLIREIYLDRARRVAPSYGFDLGPVLTHARRALSCEVASDLLLVGSVVVGLLIVPTSTIVVLLLLAALRVGRAASGLARDYVRYHVKGGTHDEYTHLRHRLRVLRWVRRRFTVVMALLMVGLGLAAARHFALPTKAALVGLGDIAPWTVVILGTQLLTVAVFATVGHLYVRSLRTGSTSPAAIIGPRMRTVARQQREPITIYSRFRPFIGSGIEVRTWSFVQRLIEASSGKPEGQSEWNTPPFRTADIVGYLQQHISALASDPDPETRLSGLTVNDHIFVAGTKTADLPEDVATADPTNVMADPSGHARHYLACQIESWDGEVVTTVYVHTSIQGKMLYLEFSTWALPPTREEFHIVDEPGGVGMAAYARTVGSAVGSVPTRLARALPHLATFVAPMFRATHRSSDDYDIRCRGVDIGARVSARELGAGLDMDDEERPSTAAATITYFQSRDVIKYAKVIERRLLASVLDFLEYHQVDVSEYRQRMVSILNVGAINYGSGAVTVSNSAIGEGATVHNN